MSQYNDRSIYYKQSRGARGRRAWGAARPAGAQSRKRKESCLEAQLRILFPSTSAPCNCPLYVLRRHKHLTLTPSRRRFRVRRSELTATRLF
ncbi:hypothetical protein EVAR_91461_1 [Eumeta japonica]|uniref:Uncharacterized protein n=1 Tax=Eumeta variegata TaxID=151549 RepID=A0A4C1X373_EUMVA|nr:hypothetical protein EVAR_91461_1 [Eumeta japonica]